MAVTNDFIFLELDSGQNCFILPCYWQTGLLWFWKPMNWSIQFNSITQSCLTLQPHRLQHAGFPAITNSWSLLSLCPSSHWCHPTTSSSVIPFSFCPQSFPASGSVPMSQFFTSGSQSIGVSALASVLPMNIKDWFSFGWNGWISLQFKGLLRVFSNTTVQKHRFFGIQLSL